MSFGRLGENAESGSDLRMTPLADIQRALPTSFRPGAIPPPVLPSVPKNLKMK